MDKVKTLLSSPVFFGIVRHIIGALMPIMAAHGYFIKSDVEQIASGVVFLAVLAWSAKSKKPRKISIKKEVQK